MSERQTNKTIDKVLTALERDETATVQEALSEMHPADVVSWLAEADEAGRKRLLSVANDEHLAALFEHMSPEDRRSSIEPLSDQRLAQVMAYMAPDDAADLMHEMGLPRARRVLRLIREPERKEISELFAYPQDTAGGRMTLDVVALREDLTVKDAIAELRRQAPTDAETIYYAYVCDAEHRLVGVLSLRTLLGSQDEQTVADIMYRSFVAVTADTDQEDVAKLFERYSYLAIPVIDDGGHLLGIVTVDDAMDAAEEEATEDIFITAGLSVADAEMLRSERILRASIPQVLKLRLPWLLVVLVGGLTAGGVIGQYEEILQSVVALAIFIPVMMDMGGNVGTQSSTIFVRGLVLGHIELDRRIVGAMVKEAFTGFTIGAISGLGAGLVAWVWQGEMMIGLVVFLAMALTCTLASMIGFGIPWVMSRLGADPAAASGPFITTIKDITGLLIYFSLATALLSHLM